MCWKLIDTQYTTRYCRLATFVWIMIVGEGKSHGYHIVNVHEYITTTTATDNIVFNSQWAQRRGETLHSVPLSHWLTHAHTPRPNWEYHTNVLNEASNQRVVIYSKFASFCTLPTKNVRQLRSSFLVRKCFFWKRFTIYPHVQYSRRHNANECT